MIFATGIEAPEGPFALSDGSWLCVEMSPATGTVTQVSADGQSKRVIATTGRPNGLTVDRAGNIWAADPHSRAAGPALVRVTMDGAMEIFATECDGEQFLFPNDVVVGPDGMLYMTDSGILWEEWSPGEVIVETCMTIATNGRVYKIDPRTRAVEKLDEGFHFTNGLVFGPDNYLYVNETQTGTVFRYPWRDGKLGKREPFVNVWIENGPTGPGGLKGPDGMKFGMDGNLYCAVVGQGYINVVAPNGKSVRQIRCAGRLTTNLAFGLPGTRRICVTEVEFNRLEMFDVGTDGFPLYL